MALSAADQEQLATYRAIALAQAEEEFTRLDINGDGELDRAELLPFASESLPAGCDQATKDAKINEILGSFDSNRDGKI